MDLGALEVDEREMAPVLLRLEDLREKVNMALETLIQREIDNGAGEVAKLSGEILLVTRG